MLRDIALFHESFYNKIHAKVGIKKIKQVEFCFDGQKQDFRIM